MERLAVHGHANRLQQRGAGTGHQRVVRRREVAGFRHLGGAVLRDHRQDALCQIAEVIGQVAVDPLHDGVVTDIAVAAERHLSQKVVAAGVETIAILQIVRGDDIPL